MQLLHDLKEKGRGGTRSHSLKTSLKKRLQSCRKTDCVMVMMMMMILVTKIMT